MGASISSPGAILKNSRKYLRGSRGRAISMRLFYTTVAAIVVFAAGMSLSRPVNSLQNDSAEKDAVCWSETQSAMMRMHEKMGRVRTAGDCDEDFVRMMLPHHQGAIEMARAELIHGTDPAMRRLAQEIITSQQSEIELMQLWLKKHTHAGRQRPETGGSP